jgi:chaperone required for assembly of F1-ATPase
MSDSRDIRHDCTVTSFADPQDIAAFRRAKAAGLSDVEAFALGDNGIGEWGDVTAQDHTPMAALHRDSLESRWGSEGAARGKAILVRVGDRCVRAEIRDRCSERGRCDLNPAALTSIGLNPPVYREHCQWWWEDDV